MASSDKPPHHSRASAANSTAAEASSYWDDVGLKWTNKQPDRLWCEYTDRLQIALLDRWLEGSVGQTGDALLTALKTDLSAPGFGLASRVLPLGCPGRDRSASRPRSRSDKVTQ
jgi:hypothetical protein